MKETFDLVYGELVKGSNEQVEMAAKSGTPIQ
jgi:hypothetical protein